MKSVTISLTILILCLCLPNRATSQQSNFEVNDPVVRYTVEAGLMLYRYFKAYDIAVDTLSKILDGKPFPTAIGNGPNGPGWSFSWGEFEEPYVFVVKYGIVVDGDGKVTTFDIFDERYVNDTHHMLAARAYLAVKSKVEMSKKAFNLEGLPIRIAVLPFPEKELTVFVGPAQPNTGVTRYGADFMYSVQRFSSKLTNMTRFHRSVMEIPLQLPDDSEAALIIPDTPLFSPMDIATSMQRKTTVLVISKSGNWRIYPDGRVGKFEAPRN